jgi:hypothetical protein
MWIYIFTCRYIYIYICCPYYSRGCSTLEPSGNHAPFNWQRAMIGTTADTGSHDARHGRCFSFARHGRRFSLARHGRCFSFARHCRRFSFARHGRCVRFARHGRRFSFARHGRCFSFARHGRCLSFARHGLRFSFAGTRGRPPKRWSHTGNLAMRASTQAVVSHRELGRGDFVGPTEIDTAVSETAQFAHVPITETLPFQR